MKARMLLTAVLSLTASVTHGAWTWDNINPAPSWADSYSHGGVCYIDSNLDHGIGSKVVDGYTVAELAQLLPKGPGRDGNPVYNDVQCGNGPPNDAGDETLCPGRVDIGKEGCLMIGPKWDLSTLTQDAPGDAPVKGLRWGTNHAGNPNFQCHAAHPQLHQAQEKFLRQCADYYISHCALRTDNAHVCYGYDLIDGEVGPEPDPDPDPDPEPAWGENHAGNPDFQCFAGAWEVAEAQRLFARKCDDYYLSHCATRIDGRQICYGYDLIDSEAEPGPNPEPEPEPEPVQTSCLVTLYSQDDYQGQSHCLTQERYYNQHELASMGLAAGATRSVKIADGYYARFNFTGSRDDGWDMVMRGNDASLFLGEDPGGFAWRNVDIEKRTVYRERPRVFMGMHGSNRLAPSTLDDEWTYVRENLDGIWENNAHISLDEMAAIYRKVATRTMILEQAGEKSGYLHPIHEFAEMQRRHPDIVLNREAMALYKNPATEWNVDDILRARSEYVTNPDVPQWMKFKNVYGGFQPQQFLLPQDFEDDPVLAQTGAAAVIDQIDGGFIECGSNRCRAHYKRAMYNGIEQIREGGRPFIWFAGASLEAHDTVEGYFKAYKQAYFRLEADDMLRPHDVVMFVNYNGLFPSTPEITDDHPGGAPTATGILYWLLQQ